MNRFMERAKEVSVHISLHVLLNNFQNGWLIKTSAKAEKDISQYYGGKRNYLKAQVSSFVKRKIKLCIWL